MTEELASDDRECLDPGERATTSPADVPGTALCLHDLAAGPSLRTMPMPGNPVPSRSKMGLKRGCRPPAFIGKAAHPLRPQPGGRADGRRWAAFAVEANAAQKAGAGDQRQRRHQRQRLRQ